MSRKNNLELNFEDIFDRIKRSTGIKNSVQLAEIIEVTQPAVSKYKKKNIFPLDWAFLIAEKYNLELIWLIRGEEKGKNEIITKQRANHLLDEIEEWLEREKQKEPKILDWFEVEFKENFPKFAEWKRKVDSAREAGLAQQQKIA
jgi:predicted transcriptional regulator